MSVIAIHIAFEDSRQTNVSVMSRTESHEWVCTGSDILRDIVNVLLKYDTLVGYNIIHILKTLKTELIGGNMCDLAVKLDGIEYKCLRILQKSVDKDFDNIDDLYEFCCNKASIKNKCRQVFDCYEKLSEHSVNTHTSYFNNLKKELKKFLIRFKYTPVGL